MLMINTNALKTNQTFKNYKELCEYLDEPIKTGKSKQLQLKDWERYFSYKKEGQKFIITEIFDTPKEKIDKRTNGNRSKYVQPFMDYVMSTFNEKCIDEYYTISNWSTTLLRLLDKDICNSVYMEDQEIFDNYGKLGVTDLKLYRTYISTVKSITRNMILKTFGWLEKRDYIKYQEGHKFYYQGEKYNKTVCTNEVNSLIDDIEREICQQLSDEHFKNKNIKGKQLVYVLQHSNNKKLLKTYMDMRMKAFNDSDTICSAVNDAIWEKDINSNDFVEGKEKCLLSVYKAFRIVNFDSSYEKVNNKQEIIDIIQELALRHMMNIKYKRYGEEYCPYDNEFSLDEIRKINNALFKDSEPKVTLLDMAGEILDELCEDYDNPFFMDLSFAS